MSTAWLNVRYLAVDAEAMLEAMHVIEPLDERGGLRRLVRMIVGFAQSDETPFSSLFMCM